MMKCAGCGEENVDPLGPARHDVLSPENDPEAAAPGPYCTACWPSTATGQAEQSVAE